MDGESRFRGCDDALFERWRLHRPDLVRDGIVDADAYAESAPRLLFVMKEVNDPGGGRWDLREFLAEGGRTQSWDNVTRWVLGIRSLPDDIAWEQIAKVSETLRSQTLKTIAVMNIKKSPGGHTAINDHLLLAAKDDAALLREQFSLYEAEVVVCCGEVPASRFDQMAGLPTPLFWRQTSRGIWFKEFAPGRFAIAFAHPEARVQDSILHYAFVDAVREVVGRR